MALCEFSAQYALGITFLCLANFIWAAASVLQQYIYDDLNFSSPFALTYIGTSVFILFLPINELFLYFGFKKLPHERPVYGFKEGFQKWYDSFQELHGVLDDSANGHLLASRHASNASSNVNSDVGDSSAGVEKAERLGETLPPAPYTHFQAFEIACIISPAWFLGNLLYNYSLFWTTITSSTVLSNLSAAFTLFMAWYVQIEKISVGKIIGVILSFSGALIVTLHDSGEGDGGDRRRVLLGEQGGNMTQSIVGDMMAIFSAFLYGFYIVIIRMRTTDAAEENRDEAEDSERGNVEAGLEVTNPAHSDSAPQPAVDIPRSSSNNGSSAAGDGSSFSSPSSLQSRVWSCIFGTEKVAVPFELVLGYVGVLVIVTLSPVLVIQGVLCLEDVCCITAEAVGFILLLAVGANFVSEYLWARSMLLTTPTVATVGLSMTIPLAYASDIVIGAPGAGSIMAGVGAVLVIAGFVFVNVEDDKFLQQLRDMGVSLGCL